MRLKEMRLSRGLTAKQLIDGKLPKEYYSMIETGRFLPTVPVLSFICVKLACNPLDIYEQHEIDLIHCMDAGRTCKHHKGDSHKIPHRIAFRVPETIITALSDVLKDLGYENRQEWMNEWIRKTMRRHQKYLRQKGGQDHAP